MLCLTCGQEVFQKAIQNCLSPYHPIKIIGSLCVQFLPMPKQNSSPSGWWMEYRIQGIPVPPGDVCHKIYGLLHASTPLGANNSKHKHPYVNLQQRKHQWLFTATETLTEGANPMYDNKEPHPSAKICSPVLSTPAHVQDLKMGMLSLPSLTTNLQAMSLPVTALPPALSSGNLMYNLLFLPLCCFCMIVFYLSKFYHKITKTE